MPTLPDADMDPRATFRHVLASPLVRNVGTPLLVVVALWSVHQLIPDPADFTSQWYQSVDRDSLTVLVIFAIIGTLFIAVGLPRQSIALAGGYLYGSLSGGALALLLTLCGSAITYAVARYIGRPQVERRWPTQLRSMDGWTSNHVFTKTLALRFFPIGSNLATNIAAGVSQASPSRFFLASFVGFLPQTAVFALGGSAVGESSIIDLILAIVTLLISIIVGTYGYKHWRPCSP